MAKVIKPTAGIIIIGDEILKGQTQDTNTHFLAINLKDCGIKLQRVVVIPDEIELIAKEVKDFSEKFDYVLTSGGVGPTHDDVTFEGVAKAFNDKTFLHPEMEVLIRQFFKDVNDATLKLGQIPTTSKLNYPTVVPEGQVRYPLVSVKNVYIFPGIPTLLQRAFHRMKDDLFKSDSKSFVKQIFVTKSEVQFADTLNEFVSKYKDSVTFGSYPTWTHNYYSAKITIEADSKDLVDQIVREMSDQIPVTEFDHKPYDDIMEKVEKLLNETKDEEFKTYVQSAQKTIEKCFEQYSFDQIAIAFNGGKDNVVMAHLVHAYVQKRFPKSRLQAIYVKEKDPFREVEEFIEEVSDKYALDLCSVEGGIKDAMGEYLKSRPNVKAVILGTRSTDPGNGNVGHFAPSDGNWPSMMRVNPIIEWRYSDIWTFIRTLSLPYPILYDRGYTSLGSRKNTLPNPNLAFEDAKGNIFYKPAYELSDGTLERAGRHKKSNL